MSNIPLSIAVVTMNRAEQLKEALESCLACTLPHNTEFIIIDNASTDNTEVVVRELLDGCGYNYYYEKLQKNIGAGRGRNFAFCKSKGKYVYSLDDDAVIAPECYTTFFIKSLEILDNNENIISLTSQIYDTAWGTNRIEKKYKKLLDNVYKAKSICEGSNFLRKDFFANEPYFPNTYGYEALPTALTIFDADKENCFCDNLLAIHKPLIDKWDKSNPANRKIVVLDCAIPYAIKQKMYPKIFKIILWVAYRRRCKKHLDNFENSHIECKEIMKETLQNSRHLQRIKIKTVFKLYKEFGISIF